jgi:nicotinate phosphoribosyltransferase
VSGLTTDLYQLTMLYGYYRTGKAEQRAAFELFFRANPFGGGYTLAAGLERAVRLVEGLRFTGEDLAYLEGTGLFPDPRFLELLEGFRFTGDLDAVPEGTVVFPQEPLVQVRARLWEAQLLETLLLNVVGYASLVATKASRVVRAAQGRAVLEFGARRAQELDAAREGARAAVIGGCAGTSFVLAGREYGLAVSGTHAHSWVLSFPSELDAFRAYAELFPDNLILLVDTHDVLASGVPNAIRVFREVEARRGRPRRYGIRIDSGDLAYLSRCARALLDAAGFTDALIVASNELDEGVIVELLRQGAPIDVFGVGTRLITGYDQPALGCVYKLVAIEDHGRWIPRLKRSENPGKVTTPGVKRVWRYADARTARPILDLVGYADEAAPEPPFEAFHPVHTWKRRTVTGAVAQDLLQPILRGGERVAELPPVAAIAARAREGLELLGEEHTRLLNPAEYPVDLTPRLWRDRMALLAQAEAAHGGEDVRRA